MLGLKLGDALTLFFSDQCQVQVVLVVPLDLDGAILIGDTEAVFAVLDHGWQADFGDLQEIDKGFIFAVLGLSEQRSYHGSEEIIEVTAVIRIVYLLWSACNSASRA